MAAGRVLLLCAVATTLLAGAFLRDRAGFVVEGTGSTRTPGRRVATENVRFPSGSLRLGGTLYAPAPLAGTLPAVVMSHGGTPRGRRLALYTVAARKLAERGFIVLTLDFRSFGDSERPPRFSSPSDLDFVQDIVAAVDFLAANPHVDPARISAVGHSFGAGVAVAAALRDRRIGRVVSISPGRNTAGRFFGPGAPDPGYPSRRMSQDMGVDPPIPPALFDPHLKAYVAEAILDHPVHPPVLLVDGALESADDLAFLKDVAGRMTGPKGYVTIPGADHYFGTRQHQDGSASSAPYDARVMDALVNTIDAWLKKDYKYISDKPRERRCCSTGSRCPDAKRATHRRPGGRRNREEHNAANSLIRPTGSRSRFSWSAARRTLPSASGSGIFDTFMSPRPGSGGLQPSSRPYNFFSKMHSSKMLLTKLILLTTLNRSESRISWQRRFSL